MATKSKKKAALVVRNDRDQLLELLSQIAFHGFWSGAREASAKAAAETVQARVCREFAYKSRMDGNQDAADDWNRHCEEHAGFANTWGSAAHTAFVQHATARQLLERVAPQLLGEFPMLDYELIKSIDPVEAARQTETVRGKLLAIFAKDSGDEDSKYKKPFEAWKEQKAKDPLLTYSAFCGSWNRKQRTDSTKIKARAFSAAVLRLNKGARD